MGDKRPLIFGQIFIWVSTMISFIVDVYALVFIVIDSKFLGKFRNFLATQVDWNTIVSFSIAYFFIGGELISYLDIHNNLKDGMPINYPKLFLICHFEYFVVISLIYFLIGKFNNFEFRYFLVFWVIALFVLFFDYQNRKTKKPEFQRPVDVFMSSEAKYISIFAFPLFVILDVVIFHIPIFRSISLLFFSLLVGIYVVPLVWITKVNLNMNILQKWNKTN